jgi:hypothetical protein
MGIKIEGIDRAARELSQRLSRIQNATAKGVIEGGLYIFRQSQNQVPVRYGNLRGSGFLLFIGRGSSVLEHGDKNVTVPEGAEKRDYEAKIAKANQIKSQMIDSSRSELSQYEMGLAIGYGAEYAAKQHETPPSIYSHKGGRKWKFLQDPLNDHSDDFIKIVSRHAKRGLR